ncbi:MAG: iron-containing alcohol dehydrogenase [Armatimonadota bacterium]
MSKSFTFYSPVRLFFGEGQFDRLGEQAAKLGTHALVVTGRGAMCAAGWLNQALDLLQDAGLRATVYDGVPSNPTDATVERGAQMAREAACDFVLGLGGGSSMDAAKAIAVRATHDEPIAHFVSAGPWGDKRVPTDATLPILCVTSTAGTSSELTPLAVVSVQETRKKAAVAGEAIYARVAIDDPRLTYSAPPRVTAATGIDVLCHATEALAAVTAQPMMDLFAIQAVTLVARWLPRAFQDGLDREARYQLLLANVFAGYPLAQVGATIVHALEHPISALHPEVPHGEGLAALLPAYIRLFGKRVPEKLAKLAPCFGLNAEGSAETVVDAVASALVDLLHSVDLSVTLTDLGITADELPRIAASAQDYMAAALAKTPGDTDTDFLIHMLSMSL